MTLVFHPSFRYVSRKITPLAYLGNLAIPRYYSFSCWVIKYGIFYIGVLWTLVSCRFERAVLVIDDLTGDPCLEFGGIDGKRKQSRVDFPLKEVSEGTNFSVRTSR